MQRYVYILLLTALGLVFALLLWPWLFVDKAPDSAPSSEAQVDDYPVGSAIAWQAWSPSAQAQARRENKGIFLYFHGQWCSWCRIYQRDSLEHPASVALIQEKFVPVLVNLDQRRDLFTRLGGRGLPYTVLLDANGDILGRFTGHVAAIDLQDLLGETAQRIATAAAVPAGLEALLDGDPARFLSFLDETYSPARQRLSGISSLGTLSKRPQPMTYLLLLQQSDWRERMPGMLDVLRMELYDPVDGGFFFFSDPDQPEPALQVETSKLLGLNSLLAWLYADAYQQFGREADRKTLIGTLEYLQKNLWDAQRGVFWGSQYSDSEYYALTPAARAGAIPPRVEQVQYADISGQAIIALVRAAEALDDSAYLQWAAAALQGLEMQLAHSEGGYYHYRSVGNEAQLPDYLPAQVWPAAAWWAYYAASGETRAAQRGGELLAHLAAYESPRLQGFSERLHADKPWTESRTHGVLAWLLTGPARSAQVSAAVLPAAQRARWMDWSLGQLHLLNGGDPDDMALGVLAAQRRQN